MKEKEAISSFQRHLSWWVLGCMITGVLLGSLFPVLPELLARLEVAGISLPMAVLIWIMIYPMMLKVDFASIKNITKEPKGLFLTWIVNWAIKPFTMFAIAWFFFHVVFAYWIPAALGREYLAGAVLLGAAPCTAMVFV